MNTENEEIKFLTITLELASQSVLEFNGGPFGAIVVKGNEIVGRGYNQVTKGNDPTAHAEVVAIRDACKNLQTYQLDGCTLYSSCEPCPMCLGAIYWARPERLVFALSRNDAAIAGFDDDFIYKEINLPIGLRKIKTQQLNLPEAIDVFNVWQSKSDKKPY